MPRAVVGDWKGSNYDIGGQRTDFHLFLDHDHRYEWTIQTEGKAERTIAGTWEVSEPDSMLRLKPDQDEKPYQWWLLSITTCEGSNVILVLRSAIVAARNLPILFYRVHGDGRGYGTDWERRFAERNAAADPAAKNQSTGAN